MITFTEKHLTIIETLDIPETKAFIAFLESEILRHTEDIESTKQRIRMAEAHIKKLGKGRYPNIIDTKI